MDVALIAIAGIAIFSALSGGLALGLHLFAPRWSARKRVTVATGLSGVLPMTLPITAFLFEAAGGGAVDGMEFTLALMALLLATLLISAAVCLPSAWFVSARLERRETPPLLGDDREQPALIAAEA